MRIDGSIKTVTAGVTTLDDKRHSGVYAKKVDNFRCDPMYGLVKKPPSYYIAEITDSYDSETDAVLPFILNSVKYWLLVTDGIPSVINIADGSIETVEVESGTASYLQNITSIKDIVTTSVDNALIIANKNVTISTTDLLDTRNKSSMIVVKQAPAPYSKIDIQFTSSDGIVKHVPTITIGDESSDRGTNTVAETIAAAMEALTIPVGDNVYVQGSTVLYERADGEYAQITGTDGARDAVIATLNADTPNINNLGKYAGVDCVVQIRPDPTSDRGSFWMRADPDIFTDGEEEPFSGSEARENNDFTITVGNADWEWEIGGGVTGQFVRGFYEGVFGSINPPLVGNIGEPILIAQYAGRATPSQISTVIYLIGQLGPEALEHMYFLNNTTGRLHDSPCEYLGTENEGGTWFSYYQLTESDDRLWSNNDEIDIFMGYQPGLYGKLPEVIWKEDADPSEPNTLSSASLPHVLGKRADGVWSYGRMDDSRGIPGINQIRKRSAGNETTNPMPSFVGNTINDVGRFQNRLMILNTGSTVLSLPNKPHAWFRETVTQQLANDPIDIKSSASDAHYLDHAVSHNNDALLFSRSAQYKLDGSIGMTSQNAAMPQTTSYENDPKVRPVSNGSDVYFATLYSPIFTGVSKYSVDKESDNQDIALSITQHIQEYIKGTIKILDSSSTMNMVMCVADDPNILYIYEFLESRNNPQSAWSRWIGNPDQEIVGARFNDYTIELMVKENALIHFIIIPINPAGQIGTERTHYLDAFSLATGVTTSFESNYLWDEDRIKVWQGEGCPNPGTEITNWTSNNKTITVSPNMQGGTVVYGYPYTSRFMPARRWVRDASGIPQTASKLRITDYGFHATGTNINVDVVDGPTAWPTQVFTNPDIDNDAYHRVSFKQRHDEADIEIYSDDVLGIDILQIEWRGTYFKTGRRF